MYCNLPCGSCSHDECTTGGALDPSCDSCAAAVCNEDPYCCSVKWNTQCVDEVSDYCNSGC
jgi:hypothetical protein